ncbi:MAG TPA: NAD(P)/FAD-dependent oxidoreductase [Mycobacteriales bacterium]|nr:NAD(P)/FAD-dependent oxidoreductase [Mycobacteriales bacterium]
MTATPGDPLPARADVVVVGAGHNGLVAATLLARAGLSVAVLERDRVIGGAARTETPFANVPGLKQSTGSYLLGLMPPELERMLDLRLPLVRRDPHYFLPTADGSGRYLLMGRDRDATRRQFVEFFSAADRDADDRLQAELDQLRADLAPAWLQEPRSVEETADRFIRPELQQVFVDLVRGDVVSYLDRFGFTSELVMAMYAVTDGLSGLHAGPDDTGTGHNFLVHNMCRLPGADGTWMIVRGGMGTVSRTIADRARAAGATITTEAAVAAVTTTGGAVRGVALADGRTIDAATVVAACDPFTLAELAPLPHPLLDRLDGFRRTGTTLKVNLALRDLPTFSCLPPGAPSPFGSTIHLLPPAQPLDRVRAMWRDVQAGRLPDFPTIEWYLHTTADPSLQDGAGHHSSALFVQSVPYEVAGSTWEAELPAYVDELLDLCDTFAPGTSDLVADTFALPPPGIEAHFGIRHGHIHHVDNGFAFDARMPYATGLEGLYAASAGCHPAGSVIGAAGHNAAHRVLVDHGVAWRP